MEFGDELGLRAKFFDSDGYDMTDRNMYAADDAHSAQVWDGDMCLVEWTRHRNGWWVVTGGDANPYDVPALRGHRDAQSATDAALKHYASV